MRTRAAHLALALLATGGLVIAACGGGNEQLEAAAPGDGSEHPAPRDGGGGPGDPDTPVDGGEHPAPGDGAGGPADPDTPVDDGGAGAPDASAGPARVTPRPGMADVRPRRFEEVEPLDERTLAVRFYSGVEPCYVLDRVEVVEAAESVTITLYEGSDPAEPDAVCIEIAVWKEVLVELGAPLAGREVVDGGAGAS